MEYVERFLGSGMLPLFLFALRVLTPVLVIHVVWRCYTSFKMEQRTKAPLVLLEEEETGVRFPVLYWENSIGRSRSCDITIPDSTVSRDHAVLLRREEGWFICDTGSKAGVYLNGERVDGRALVGAGDIILLGRTALTLKNSPEAQTGARRTIRTFGKKAVSPKKLLLITTLVQILMAIQSALFAVNAEGKGGLIKLLPLAVLLPLEWGYYIVSMGVLRHVSFEIETVGFLLSGMGIELLASHDVKTALTQMLALVLGVALFSFLIWFMNDLERVARFRVYIGLGALLLFLANLLIGDERYGSKNWITIGPVSFQPSEFIKIAFVFVGTSTLDRLQTKKNITEFMLFAGACVGFLALLRDFGTALIFFASFLIIAFMRSGSFRTIALVLTGAFLGVLLVIRFMPYVAERFLGWGHAWEHINDNMGYQQTRVLTYMASGGLFGLGLGTSSLIYVFAADSDLAFGLLTEEQGLIMALAVIFAICLFVFYSRSDVTRSRSTFFSIASCAAAGLLLFQTALNVFGCTDLMPMTGVTFPFFSAGGSSLVSCWGLLAFIKASDERTYAARRAKRKSADYYMEDMSS